MLIASILMVVDYKKIGKIISCHLRMRGRKEHSITKEVITTKEGACQTGGETMVEAHLSLCIACTTEMTQTTAQNIAQYSWNQREKWTKTTPSLRHNPHPKNQSHNAVVTISPTILPIIPITILPTDSPKHSPGTASILLSILPLCHNQPYIAFIITANNIPSTITTDHQTNTK
jgi:hypothetical protein